MPEEVKAKLTKEEVTQLEDVIAKYGDVCRKEGEQRLRLTLIMESRVAIYGELQKCLNALGPKPEADGGEAAQK